MARRSGIAPPVDDFAQGLDKVPPVSVPSLSRELRKWGLAAPAQRSEETGRRMRSLTKATHQGTREHNVRLVMRAIAGLGPISRAEIARRTDLTRTTVSDVVSQLSEAGLVQEIGRGPSSGGKAPILLQIPARRPATDRGACG